VHQGVLVHLDLAQQIDLRGQLSARGDSNPQADPLALRRGQCDQRLGVPLRFGMIVPGMRIHIGRCFRVLGHLLMIEAVFVPRRVRVRFLALLRVLMVVLITDRGCVRCGCRQARRDPFRHPPAHNRQQHRKQ
jgi:hypothetical protein